MDFSSDEDPRNVEMRHPQSHVNGYNRDERGPQSRMGMEDSTGVDPYMGELLDLLPSRQLESSAEMASQTWKKGRKSIHLGHIRAGRENEIEDRLVASLQHDIDNDLEFPDDIDAAVRTIPTSFSKKRSIKHRLSSRKKKKLTRSKLIKYRFAMLWQHMKYEMRKVTYAFDLWHSHLITIEGCFGTSVVSYFIFLKWVLLINIPIFLLTFSFLVIPQILYRYYLKVPSGYQNNTHDFTGIELLTGTGFFENSEMYYGFYTNETVEITSGYEYEMKKAYLFTSGGYYLFCLIILGYSYLRSYRKYYIEASGTISLYYFNMVFCGWDYGITSSEAGRLKHSSIYNEFKEYLAGHKGERGRRTRDEVAKKWFFRLITWTIVLALLGGAGYATYTVSTELSITPELVNRTSIPVISPLAMPVVISTMQLFIPMVFTFLEAYEGYSEPKNELYVHMFREMALKATMLGVLMYFWLDIASSKLKCWETFVGQEIYRLVIVDLIFTLGYSFFMEFIRKLISLKWKRIERAEFAIGRHTLELVYSQSLCWLGIFYSPLLPVVVILKLIVIFYVKRYSVVQNCRPSLKPWRASRTHTIFVRYLFLFFILTCVAVGCSIFLIQPSKSCGPYQNYGTCYEVIEELINKWRDEHDILKEIFNFIDSPGFISAVLILLCMVLYYVRAMMLSHKKMVEQFKQQLSSEGKDKKFLMNLLHQVKVRGRRVSTLPGPAIQRNKESSSPSGKSGGNAFARTVAESMMSSASGHK